MELHRIAKFDDRRMEIIMGRLLQTGVLLASVVVITGGILYVRAHFGAAVDYRNFTGEPADLRSPSRLFELLRAGDPMAVIQLGLLVLIVTPIARVVFAAIAFALERDRLYLMVSLIVFAVLMVSLLYLA